MLFSQEVNDWGELTYIPTSLGTVMFAVVIIALLIVAVLKSPESPKKLSPRQLVFCAMAVCLGAVLSNIKVFSFPTGGSITLFSMLAVALPGYWFGIHAGILAGIAHGLLQLVVDPYILFPSQVIVDYVLAFGALGLSGMFYGKRNGLAKGYIVGVIGRYIFAVISGWIFFGSYAWEGWGALPYSVVYNAIYIFAEAVVTLIVLNIGPVKSVMDRLRIMAVGHSSGTDSDSGEKDRVEDKE